MENSAEPSDPESSTPKWHQDPKDPNLVRYWNGFDWSMPSTINFALLTQAEDNFEDNFELLTQIRDGNRRIEDHLHKIRFRVGFLALVVLVPILLSLLMLGGFLSMFSDNTP